MTINVVPTLLPWVNLVLSLVAFLGTAALMWRFRRVRDLRRRLLGWALLFATMVLVGGAAFQAGLLSLDLWIVLGSGGRAAAAILVVALFVTRRDSDALNSTSGEMRRR